ncbi:hypothetical protein EB796_011393 [Bugula neritina]|uniref:GST C-terminal domain-containing protein n=1 Tax=Bugula neritina TaxID=10212 RepID=A0A7J7JWM5_BUGNE|nr:hypothetical protein EB796_011393 [Bugula neritina]
MATKTVLEEDGTIKGFFDWVKQDGSTPFQPEAGRYHLYGQHLCPFSNRATIGRVIKGLESAISYDNLDYVLPEGPGWKFSPEKPGCDADSINGCSILREVYDASAKKLGAKGFCYHSVGFSGGVTVPVLYDRKLGRIVSNDSASILRMLNSEFNEFCATPAQAKLDLFPPALQSEIEEAEAWQTKSIIFAVYGPAYAKTQEDFDAAIVKLFDGLDKAEELLSKQRYVVGKQMTEADIRLFVTLVRFDAVYVHMKCYLKRVNRDYPALWGFVRDIYQTGNIKDVVVFDEILKGYFLSKYMKPVNPYGIVPKLPPLDFHAPHGRELMV